MIKVILFDIDNTLLDFKRCAEESIKEAFDKWGLEYKKEYLSIFMEINNRYWRDYEDGKISREYLYQNRWKDIFKTIGLDVPGYKFEKDFVNNLYHSHEKIEGVDEVLEELSKKYNLSIASNSSYDEQRSRLKHAEILDYFNKIYTSEDIGHAKPSYEFFNEVHQDLGSLEKEEILIIGDSEHADIQGGREYGIKTCWFNFLEKDIEVESDYKINKLTEILDIL